MMALDIFFNLDGEGFTCQPLLYLEEAAARGCGCLNDYWRTDITSAY